jgi:hypothetical protein
MKKEIVLDQKPYYIKENELPCLITYPEKTGGSDFSIMLAADLFSRGSKILFFTAYPMAKDNFTEQISESEVSYITNKNELSSNSRCILVESGNEELFVYTIQKLDDINDRVIFIKNIEMFSEALLMTCINFEKIILSGDIDLCSNIELILQKKFHTKIFFNQPNSMKDVLIPQLEKYTGYFLSENMKGITKLRLL